MDSCNSCSKSSEALSVKKSKDLCSFRFISSRGEKSNSQTHPHPQNVRKFITNNVRLHPLPPSKFPESVIMINPCLNIVVLD